MSWTYSFQVSKPFVLAKEGWEDEEVVRMGKIGQSHEGIQSCLVGQNKGLD